MQIETGIYESYLGGLFFVEEVGLFFDPRKGDEPAVFLRPLSNQGLRCCTLVEHFSQERPGRDNLPVKRFELVRALPVEKMQILLPGKLVYHRYASLLNFVVIEVRTDQKKVEVMLNRTDTNRNIQVELISFLNLFKSAE